MLTVFRENVSPWAPDVVVGGISSHGPVDQQLEDVGKIGDVDVVPSRFALADDRDDLSLEDQTGQLVQLSSSLTTRATAAS